MVTPLLVPRETLNELVTTELGLSQVIEQLNAGSGPLAIDAERASGYRYSQRAYLIQIFRREGGLHLIDPIAIGATDLWYQMSENFADEEWIIHASTQDLPCLREVGLHPKLLFDTELGARIAGCERVGLGPLAESLLELALAKEHSAVDWSIRPLRSEWLNYAALDVDILVDLRDAVESLLAEQGKLEWAKEDFAAILQSGPKAPRQDPWRRTSGMHKIRDRQSLAIIRGLWLARDEYAREIDISPGRVFNDEVLIAIASRKPESESEFEKLITKRGRLENMPISLWWQSLQQILTEPISSYPELRASATTLPPMKTWKEKNPLAYARLTHARAGILAIAQELNVPAENLISPELIRRLCWEPIFLEENHQTRLSHISALLTDLGARKWQIAHIAPMLEVATKENTPLPPVASTEDEAGSTE